MIGLHVQYKILSKSFVDEYEPLEEGLDKVTTVRSVSTLEAILTKTKPEEIQDTIGYMGPLPEEEVDEETFIENMKKYEERKERRKRKF